jgi:hypothetical protein
MTVPEPTPVEYPPAVADLLREMPLAPLGPGRPQHAFKTRLDALTDAVLGPRITDQSMAACCRAALWLAFDFLDESHEISQGIHTVEGSYWHALMHRREPDHSNAAYWLKRVGTHPVFAGLAKDAAVLGYQGQGTTWDPFAFNDRCEEHRGKEDETEELLRKVQRVEWELLFRFCFRHATGGTEGK